MSDRSSDLLSSAWARNGVPAGGGSDSIRLSHGIVFFPSSIGTAISNVAVVPKMCGGSCSALSRAPKLYFFTRLVLRACQSALSFLTAQPGRGIPPLTVSWWKLQPDDLQDEFGKLAPRVTQHQRAHSHSGVRGANLTNEVRQNAWFCTALEELAQMCGAFLAATATAATPPPAGGASAPPSAGAPHVKITVQVGDALNFCDALLTASASPTSAAKGAPNSTVGASGAVFEPLSFQQGSLQPLHLRADEFGYPPKFDVISTSNLAEHLGVRVEGRKSRGCSGVGEHQGFVACLLVYPQHWMLLA